MKYLRKFQTHSDYEDFVEGGDYITPNVSICVSDSDIHYNKEQLAPGAYTREYNNNHYLVNSAGQYPSLPMGALCVSEGVWQIRTDNMPQDWERFTPSSFNVGDEIVTIVIDGITYQIERLGTNPVLPQWREL